MFIRINNICHSSVNGPGNRLVIWTQGCNLRCKGCFNQDTHPKSKGVRVDVDELLQKINEDPSIEGITISGGEPFLQPIALRLLLSGVRETLTKIVFTGYTVEELYQSVWKKKALKHADLIIAGRYNHSLRHPYLGKKFLLTTDRIDMCYFMPKKKVEYSIGTDTVTKTGIF